MPSAGASTGSLIESIDARDRKLLVGCFVLFALLIVALAFLSRSRQQDTDPTPYSYSTSEHGAKAAFELLLKAGYKVEAQNAPLSEIVDRIDNRTTLVIAEPYLENILEARATVKQALDRGARVLATGPSGAMLLPDNHLHMENDLQNRDAQNGCEEEANGFGEIANSGKVQIRGSASWQQTQPLQRVEYTCNGRAVVVTYTSGTGEAIWWANSYPLENTGIQHENNLALLLNSIGPLSNHVIWDESLHGDVHSLWSYADGSAMRLIWWQLTLLAVLLLLSFGRRSGPLRPDPIVSRAAPLEFVYSLGSLYQKAGATNVAVTVAYQRFRQVLERQLAVAHWLPFDSPALLAGIKSRIGDAAAGIQKDLVACENATAGENVPELKALSLVQALHDDGARIGAKPEHE
jgi:hypothetical protein